MSEIKELQEKIADFASKRQWEVFHTPKNLVMALTGEVGELSAEFQWLTPQEAINIDKQKLNTVGLEIADVAIYLFRLCSVLNIDLKSVIESKLQINENRFPEL